MSFLSDLADAAERIVDKAIDYRIADVGLIDPARAGELDTYPYARITPVQQVPLSGNFGQYLPFIVAGGVGLVLILVLAR